MVGIITSSVLTIAVRTTSNAKCGMLPSIALTGCSSSANEVALFVFCVEGYAAPRLSPGPPPATGSANASPSDAVNAHVPVTIALAALEVRKQVSGGPDVFTVKLGYRWTGSGKGSDFYVEDELPNTIDVIRGDLVQKLPVSQLCITSRLSDFPCLCRLPLQTGRRSSTRSKALMSLSLHSRIAPMRLAWT